jgi:hypothetical protein
MKQGEQAVGKLWNGNLTSKPAKSFKIMWWTNIQSILAWKCMFARLTRFFVNIDDDGDVFEIKRFRAVESLSEELL